MELSEEQEKQRAEVYLQLINYEPFLHLVKEMKETVEDKTGSVINTFGDTCDEDKGIIKGINQVIDTPFDVVREVKDKQTENSEPR
jgi:hypothetical protein